MSDALIVVNAGSSSLKFSMYGVVGEQLEVVWRGQVQGLGTSANCRSFRADFTRTCKRTRQDSNLQPSVPKTDALSN